MRKYRRFKSKKTLLKESKAKALKFPVSSGKQHRLAEGTSEPVPAKEKLIPLPPLPPARQSTNIFKNSKTRKEGLYLSNFLRGSELSSGSNQSAKTSNGGVGMHLLQKMGWKPGEGLGREKSGSVQPLMFDNVKLDKRGLVSKEESYIHNKQFIPNKKKVVNPVAQAKADIHSKNPISVLNELTSKNKWKPAAYEVVTEEGPTHSRTFVVSVTVNGKTYTPNTPPTSKKEAKLNAARLCLQKLGIITK